MKKLTLLIALAILLSSCTQPTGAITLVDCPCKVVGIETNKERGYKIIIQEINKDENWLSFYTHSIYKMGDTIH